MFGLGFWEIALLAIIIFLIFGGKRLPAMGRALGEGVKALKQGLPDDSPPGPGEKKGNNGTDEQNQGPENVTGVLSDIQKIRDLRTTGGKFRMLRRFFKI